MYDLALGDDDVLLGDDFGEDLEGDDFGDDLDAILGGGGKKRKIRTKRIQPLKQEQVMPFPRTVVATTVTTTVTAFPQRPFQTERFIFASSVAASFTVDELKVGQESMLVQTGQIPAELFSQLGVGVRLRGYIARPGVTITLTCTNISGGNATISAAIIGPALV
jgi:hypothetical protein